MKKSKPNPNANRNILWFSYGIVLLFVCMSIYFGYFIQVDSKDTINNPYNARIEKFADKTIRGKILSDDGTVLAETNVSSDGTETRKYPYGSLFAHVVGYSTVGKTGIESLADFYLLRSNINAVEKIVNQLADEKSIGDNVVTTLNVKLQTIASDALGDRKGAVIAMEPGTGKVLAMVSKPAYDPNAVAAQWSELVSSDSSNAVLLNRATQGLYPPGSTFKVVTALQYMREHPNYENDYQFECSGIFEYESLKIQCYHQNAHGTENFGQAFANSCNGAFSSMGLDMNLKEFKALAEQLMFNKEQPLSMPYSKSVFQMEADAEDWEKLQTAIGQGGTLMTPMHNLMLTAAIANGGMLMKPYVIDHVENAGGDVIKKFMPSNYGELMSADEAKALKTLMTQVVTEGTGSALRTDQYQAAGKTGSAEFETGKETHAWFVGYAPADDPKIAVCVLVEEGGSGGQTAAPIARKLFDAYLLP